MSTSFSTRLLYLSFLILLGWTLSLFYGFLSRALAPGWVVIGLLHSLVALALWRWARQLRVEVRLGLRAYLPALAVGLGSVGLAGLSRLLVEGAPPLNGTVDLRLLGFVLWIPLVEELVFRYGIGGWARARLGMFWGAYGSALVFALAHGSGVWHELPLPLGPLLLGLCCEWIYVVSGRITAAMAFHAACNASGFIFAALDERWLDWLQAFYLTV